MRGLKILGIGTSEYEIMDGKARPVNNVAEMRTIDNLEEGNFIKTVGYHEANDGGGALYRIRAKQEGDVDDRGMIHVINENLVAELIIKDNKVNIKQFGARNDKTEEIGAILNRIVANTKIQEVVFEHGDYVITETINLTRRIVLDFNKSNVEYTGSNYCFNISTNFKNKPVIKRINLTGTFDNGCIKATRGGTNWGVSFNLYDSLILKFAHLIDAESIFNSIVEDVIFQSHGTFTYNAHIMSNANRFVNCYFMNYDGNTEQTYPNYKFIFTKVKNMLFVGCSFEQYKTLINNTDCAHIRFINCETEQQTGSIAKNRTGIVFDNDFMHYQLKKAFEDDGDFTYSPLSKLEGGEYLIDESNTGRMRSSLLAKPGLRSIKKYINNGTGSVHLYTLSDKEWQVRIPINTIQKTVTNASELTQSMDIPCEWQANESTLFTIYIVLLGSDDSRLVYESKFLEAHSESFINLGIKELNKAVWSESALENIEVTEEMNLSNYKVTLSKPVKQCTVIMKYEKLGYKLW